MFLVNTLLCWFAISELRTIAIVDLNERRVSTVLIQAAKLTVPDENVRKMHMVYTQYYLSLLIGGFGL